MTQLGAVYKKAIPFSANICQGHTKGLLSGLRAFLLMAIMPLPGISGAKTFLSHSSKKCLVVALLRRMASLGWISRYRQLQVRARRYNHVQRKVGDVVNRRGLTEQTEKKQILSCAKGKRIY